LDIFLSFLLTKTEKRLIVRSMRFEKLKEAVKAGKTVCWKNDNYKLILDSKNRWLIGFCGVDYVGLYYADNKTSDYNPSDFYVK